MVIKKVDLYRESCDFDKIYSERFKNMESIILDDERIEDYFYKNPWRWGFSRRYAFGQVIDLFNNMIENSKHCELEILEIGCGNGWFSINVNKNNDIKFTSIDVSKEAINIAKFYADQANVTQNEYIHSPIETFNSLKKYDIVVCINTLHHFTDILVFCEKVKNNLKDEGRLFVYDVCPEKFSIYNASYVLLTKMVLIETGNYYLTEITKNIEEELSKILFEWQNETDDLKQSVHDHFHSSDIILEVLRNNFCEKYYSEFGGMLTRLIGGIRGKSSESIGRILINIENVFLKSGLISPYSYCFIGSK